MKIFLLVLLSVLTIASQAEAQGATWRIRFEWSGYLYARCWLEIGESQGYGAAQLDCIPNLSGARLHGYRKVSPSEAATIKTLVDSSDFYGGGFTGFGQGGEDADFVTLLVSCCGRQDWISIVVSGNRTFEQGPRRELLEVFRKLRGELAQPVKP